jgi:hypothetical protein
VVRVVAAMARGLMVLGSLCSSAADRLILFFQHTAVADKQCGGLQIRVDVGALPTRRAIFQK